MRDSSTSPLMLVIALVLCLILLLLVNVVWRWVKRLLLPRARYIFKKSDTAALRFIRRRHRAYFNEQLGEVVLFDPQITPQGAERLMGASMILNKDLLVRHRDFIKHGRIARDRQERRKAVVPGFSTVAKDCIKPSHHGQKGSTIYLWDRTHLLPFRYALSEGVRIPHLLITGTHYLNTGNQPDRGRYIDERGAGFNSRRWRKEYLMAALERTPNLRADCFNNGSQCSLDDLEQVSDWLIHRHPKDRFRYGVVCHYASPSEVIPNKVTVCVTNLTQHRTCFEMTLTNCK